MARTNEMRVIKITGIEKTTQRGVKVVIEETGLAAWVPNRWEYFLPGHIVIPEYLARKILPEHEKKAPPPGQPRTTPH